VVWSAVRTAMLKNAVRMTVNLIQGIEAVTKSSLGRVNNMRISNVSTFV
jgi:hypothetical protein